MSELPGETATRQAAHGIGCIEDGAEWPRSPGAHKAASKGLPRWQHLQPYKAVQPYTRRTKGFSTMRKINQNESARLILLLDLVSLLGSQFCIAEPYVHVWVYPHHAAASARARPFDSDRSSDTQLHVCSCVASRRNMPCAIQRLV